MSPFVQIGSEIHSNFMTCVKSLRSLSEDLNSRLSGVVLKVKAMCPRIRTTSAATQQVHKQTKQETLDLNNNTLSCSLMCGGFPDTLLQHPTLRSH